jgi:hypothetical protein
MLDDEDTGEAIDNSSSSREDEKPYTH